MLLFCCKCTIARFCPSCYKTVLTLIERKIFWNSVLRAGLETYFTTSIFFWYSYNQLTSTGLEGRISTSVWFAIGAYLFGFPILTFQLLFRNWRTIWKPDMRARYDSLYQNVEVYKGPGAFAFTLYFCMRRLIFAFVITRVLDTIVYQILLLDLGSTLMLAYFVSALPMADKLNNAIQIFNETAVLVCIWSMFLFTNYVGSPEVRHNMGQKVLFFVALNIFINLVVLLVVLIRKIWKAIRIWFIKRKLKKAMRLKFEKRIR